MRGLIWKIFFTVIVMLIWAYATVKWALAPPSRVSTMITTVMIVATIVISAFAVRRVRTAYRELQKSESRGTRERDR